MFYKGQGNRLAACIFIQASHLFLPLFRTHYAWEKNGPNEPKIPLNILINPGSSLNLSLFNKPKGILLMY